MKGNRNLITGILLLVAMILPGLMYAQQPSTFYKIAYIKVLPGKESEFTGMIKTVDVKVQQERVNKRAISGWYLYKVLSPAGSSTEYDYVTVTIIDRYKLLFETPYTYDSAFKKTFRGQDAKFFAGYYSRQAGVYTMVKEEIYTGLGLADSSSRDGFQSNYAVVDFMQPKPDKFGQYIKMELDTFRVIHRERVKLGDISQWACMQLILPYDLKTGYSIMDFNFYNDLEKMMTSKYMEALKNTFPAVDLNNLFQSVLVMRDNPKADLLQLFLYASPMKR